jgi:hypothetical protein
LTAVQPITYHFPNSGVVPVGAGTGTAGPSLEAMQKVANPITIKMAKRRINDVYLLFLITDVLPPIS